MSDQFNLSLGGKSDRGYTIRTMCGCRLVFGAIPASDFPMLAHGFSKKALMSTAIADRIGATCVIGEPADLEELGKMDLPVSEKRQRDYLAAYHQGLTEVAMWLRIGERGASSDAMCKRIFGLPSDAGASHPHDPDDLRRCLLFLDATGAHGKVSTMASVSREWSSLASAWDEIVKLFRAETAAGKSAPLTYAALQEAIR